MRGARGRGGRVGGAETAAAAAVAACVPPNAAHARWIRPASEEVVDDIGVLAGGGEVQGGAPVVVDSVHRYPAQDEAFDPIEVANSGSLAESLLQVSFVLL